MPQPTSPLEPGKDRVRAVSPRAANERLDREMRERVARYAHRSRSELTARIHALEREWDMERVLILHASCLLLTGLLLGRTRDARWRLLPAAVGTFLLQHAVQGWCPPVFFFRRLGVRTRKEIDAERSAMKALRGDYDSLRP
jgi:hypothetical protein